MKQSYLLPNLFKKVGLCMVLPFTILCILCLTGVMDDVCIWMKMPALVSTTTESRWFFITESCIIDELSMLGLLVSLVFIALSREHDEDEMTVAIRMQSFVWSVWATSLIIILGILLIYNFAFIYFLCVAMYLYLLLYIIKFNFAMCRERRG